MEGQDVEEPRPFDLRPWLYLRAGSGALPNRILGADGQRVLQTDTELAYYATVTDLFLDLVLREVLIP